MDTINREGEYLKKCEKKMLEIKDTVTQIKEIFDGINSRFNKANEIKDRPIETFQTEMQKE